MFQNWDTFFLLVVALAIVAVVAAIVTSMLPGKKSYESKEILKPVS